MQSGISVCMVEIPIERYDYFVTNEGRRRAAEDYVKTSSYPSVDMICNILGLNVETKNGESLPGTE